MLFLMDKSFPTLSIYMSYDVLCREDERETSSSASSRQIQELHEEMTIMKGQLGELKQMMKVSFDLQLDIQRAIRQEVAAALTAFLTTQPSPVASGGAANTCPIPTLGKNSNIVMSPF